MAIYIYIYIFDRVLIVHGCVDSSIVVARPHFPVPVQGSVLAVLSL